MSFPSTTLSILYDKDFLLRSHYHFFGHRHNWCCSEHFERNNPVIPGQSEFGMNREFLHKEPDWILSCYSNWRHRGAAEIQPEKKSNFNKKQHFLKIRFGHVHFMFYPSSIKHFFQQPDNHAFFSVYSLPCLSLSLPSAKLKHHQICLWRKVQSNQFWEFSFRVASCEISRPQSSVGGRPGVQFKL